MNSCYKCPLVWKKPAQYCLKHQWSAALEVCLWNARQRSCFSTVNDCFQYMVNNVIIFMHNYSSNFTFEWVHLKLLFTKPQRFFKIWIQYNNNVQRIHQKLWRYRQILKLLWHTDFTSHRLAATLYFSFLIWIKLNISQLFDDLTGSSAVNPTRACRSTLMENELKTPAQLHASGHIWLRN